MIERVYLPPCPAMGATIEARIVDDGGDPVIRWEPAEPLIGFPRWDAPQRAGLDDWAAIVCAATRYQWLLDVRSGPSG